MQESFLCCFFLRDGGKLETDATNWNSEKKSMIFATKNIISMSINRMVSSVNARKIIVDFSSQKCVKPLTFAGKKIYFYINFCH